MKKTAWFLTVILAICLCLAAGAEEAFALKPGDTGDRVLELNTRLRQMNYTRCGPAINTPRPRKKPFPQCRRLTACR